MRGVFVAGASATAFGKFPDQDLRSLTEAAVEGALVDAGARSDQIEAAYFANAAAGLMTGQEMIRGQVALRNTGLLGIPVVNVENACASGATAFHLAWTAVAAGLVDTAIAVGAEKLTHPDKARSFAAFNGALDRQEFDVFSAPDATHRSPFMGLYAGLARQYMRQTGATWRTSRRSPSSHARTRRGIRRRSTANRSASSRSSRAGRWRIR